MELCWVIQGEEHQKPHRVLICKKRKCLIHCNLDESRAIAIGFLYLAKNNLLSKDYYIAENEFRNLYPYYNPKNGIRLFIKSNWNKYVN